MPARCTICDHSSRNDIDRELFGSATLRDIGARYGVSKDALARHRENHVGPRLARSIARREDLDADKLTSWLVGLNDQTLAIMLRAQQEDDLATALRAVAEARKNMEVLGRLGGWLEAGPVVHEESTSVVAILGDLRSRGELSRDDLIALARGGELPAIEGTARTALPVGPPDAA